MKIRVADVPPEGREVVFSLQVSHLNRGGPPAWGAEFKSDATANLSVRRVKRNLEVSGNVVTSAGLVCSRCLKPIEEKIDCRFKMVFCPQPQRGLPAERELSHDDLEVTFYKGEEVDLAAAVDEALVLALPQKPVCSEGCRGLCAGCGANLNEDECRCPGRASEPRFAVLKDFKTGR